MTLSCTIQGSPVSILAGSFSASYTLNNRPTGSIRVYYTGSTAPGDEGDEVIVTRTDDSTRVFAGRITSVAVAVDEVGNKVATFQLGGYESLADRRIVAEVYFNRSAGYIVADLITKYLAADGVTAGAITAGATIPRAVFGYQQLSAVLRNLAEANGYIWYIDTAKALHFTERDAVVSPNTIDIDTQGDRAVRGVTYDKSLTQYRNRQFIQYKELTSERTERFAGDGQTKTWNVEFPIASKPDVFVNDVAQTVGISGLDPEGTADFYWSSGSPTVAQDLLETALSGAVVDIFDEEQLTPYGSILAPLTLVTGVHAFGEYIVVGFSDTNGGYVLYKRNGAAWEQVNNLNVFTSRRADRIVGIGSYFLGYEAYGVDSVDTVLYQIIGDAIRSVATVATATASTQRRYLGASSRHLAYEVPTLGNQEFEVDVIADDGTLTAATNTDNGKVLDYRFFVGYHDGYALIIDDASGDYAGGTLRQLAITGNDYAITADPTNLTGTYDRAFASTEGYFFARTSAGIEWYKRTGTSATLTKLTTLTAPSAYTFADNFTNSHPTDIAVYDDWLIVPVDESPYLLAWRIDRDTDTLVYDGPYTGGLTEAPRFVRTFSDGFVAAEYETDGVIAGYTATVSVDNSTPADVLKVVYFGTFPNVTQVDDIPEQTARIAIEGGTGIYEAFQASTDTDSEPDAIDIGQAILARYGRVPRAMSLDTRVTGFDTGQIVTVNWPPLGITNEDFLIERMAVRDVSASTIWYSLRLISGRDIGNWQEFWRSLRPTASFDFGGSDTLPRAVSVQDMAGVIDEVTTVSAATETNWGEGNWQQMEWQSRI